MSEDKPGKIDKFDEKLDAVEKPFFVLFSKEAQNSRRIAFLTVIVGFDLIMFVCFGYVALRADHAVDEAEKARRIAIFNQCESGNEFRRLDLQRWNYVLEISSKPDPDESPAQRKKNATEVKQFRQYIEKADELKDCNKFVEDQLKLIEEQKRKGDQND